MSKLTDEEWEALKITWEDDPREGYRWLKQSSPFDISEVAIRKRALRDSWKKTKAALKKTKKQVSENQKSGFPEQKKQNLRKVAQKIERKTLVKFSAKEKTVIKQRVRKLQTNSELNDKERMFVAEYVKDFDPTRAAQTLGLSYRQGYRMLNSEHVSKAIQDATEKRLLAASLSGEDIIKMWADAIKFDMNELVELRRRPCGYCYAEGGQPELIMAEYWDQKEDHDKLRRSLLRADPENDIGEFPPMTAFKFIDVGKRPNPECPICHGHGIPMRYMKDTRDLSPTARRMYAGIEQVKGDLNFVVLSKERAMDNLARALGLFKDKEEAKEGNGPTADALQDIFDKLMETAKDRQRTVDEKRGLDIEGIEDIEALPIGDMGQNGEEK